VPPDPERVRLFQGREFQIWEMAVEGELRFIAWMTGTDGVFFRANSDVVLNYTIQSGLELETPELCETPWVHTCLGLETCGACFFAEPG
jgi:hypothetical protein